MATTSQSRGSTSALTITLASLANSTTAGQQSTAIDNSSALAIDYDVGGSIMTGTTPTANATIEVWAYSSWDGTEYTGGATGTNGALTPTQKGLMRLIQVIQVTSTSNTAYKWHCPSMMTLFGGYCPVKFGFWVMNSSGVALNSTPGNHNIEYTPVNYASA